MIDYKKLYNQQKKQNIEIVSENLKLTRLVELQKKAIEELETKTQNAIDSEKSWEIIANNRMGQITALNKIVQLYINKQMQ